MFADATSSSQGRVAGKAAAVPLQAIAAPVKICGLVASALSDCPSHQGLAAAGSYPLAAERDEFAQTAMALDSGLEQLLLRQTENFSVDDGKPDLNLLFLVQANDESAVCHCG